MSRRVILATALVISPSVAVANATDSAPTATLMSALTGADA